MLESALGPTGCGCAQIERAEREPDPDGAAVLRASGERLQRVWQCPCATGREPPASAEGLPAPAQEALEHVERLCGGGGFTTCPLFYARLSWVRESVRARRWAERGELRAYTGEPTRVLLDAIDAVDAGIGARQHADEIERENKRKAKHG